MCLFIYSVRFNLLFSTVFMYHYFTCELFIPALASGLSLELSDSKSPQVSRALCNILAGLSNAAFWVASIFSLIFLETFGDCFKCHIIIIIIIIIIIFTRWEFFTSGFNGCLSDTNSPQVSRIVLSILAGLNNTVLWIVSIRPVVSSPPVLVSILWWLYQEHQLQFV